MTMFEKVLKMDRLSEIILLLLLLLFFFFFFIVA